MHVIAHFAALIELNKLAKFQHRKSQPRGVMTHRILENHRFSQALIELNKLAKFQHRKSQPREVMTHRILENHGFSTVTTGQPPPCPMHVIANFAALSELNKLEKFQHRKSQPREVMTVLFAQ
ncbi:hypothetical protein Ddc_19449 [Ditylenchus destructor]|nr:hypothetical protein Ddc_19449 [Ditylenchus destructor]